MKEKLKKFLGKIFYNSWFVGLSSLIWFLLRTGTKPTRAIYPCQQVARANIFVFGLPVVIPFWLKLKKCKRFRLKVFTLSLVTLFLTIGAFGFVRAKTEVVGWFWQIKGLPKREIQVMAANTFPGRVVWVHNTGATNWNFGSDYYGRHVDQNVVNNMTDQGLMALTGAGSVVEAWRQILPCGGSSCSGKKIAIKVNFNNAFWCEHFCETDCEDWRLSIDALPQPVNALIRGLKQVGIAESNIWVYDATPGRAIPGRFTTRITSFYPNVRFFDDGCRENAGFGNTVIDFHPPGGISDPPTQKITNVLVNVDYLINMPIMKKHGWFDNWGTDITLSFKNHFGSIDNCRDLHNWVYGARGDHYSSTYNPLVEIYQNPNIGDKTVLTVGDGLYGDRKQNICIPEPWNIFGGESPNSLFFSTDPVAIDSVMADILHAEGYNFGVSEWADDYLQLAANAGLGVFERGNPWGSGYSKIDFVKCDPNCPGTSPPPSPIPSPTPSLSPSLSPSPSPSPSPSYRKGDVNHDGSVDKDDALMVLRNYGKNPSQVAGYHDPVGDGKVNGIDLGWVIKEWNFQL